MTGQPCAADRLASAAAMARNVKLRGRWYVHYLLVFGGWQLVFVPAVLLWHGRGAVLITTGANALLVVLLSLYAARRPMVRRHFGLIHGLTIGGWGVLYGLALGLGLTVFVDNVPFAAAAGIACAALPACVAWHEFRTTRS